MRESRTRKLVKGLLEELRFCPTPEALADKWALIEHHNARLADEDEGSIDVSEYLEAYGTWDMDD